MSRRNHRVLSVHARVAFAVVGAMLTAQEAAGLRSPAAIRSRVAGRAASVSMADRRDARLAAAMLLCASLQMASPLPSMADGDTETFKFPPIDRNKKGRCTFASSSIGQANAARDSLYDLRECVMDGKSAGGFDISGALLADGSFKKVDFKDAQLSKVYAPGADFSGADFTDGVVDRAFFKGANFEAVKFVNTVLTSTSFEGANLKDTDFTGAYLGQFDAKKLCKNPTLDGKNPVTGADTRESAGCA
eukprot:CAMPEP_0206046492 /NCGR_PEP_ID=MMETSP1466-20131121/18738_1 /ASSEMBLY_ACC=CAM_ASM_001126 /TAXON_ID=44452 /ORGANISM="Pavlova gyrans, Strain CCMP608" /LENGTH=246 /DNA_ID=CAMNT_0053421469 /DNA_START=20 /DNA_END=760 /DNA_ORIENTATION=+